MIYQTSSKHNISLNVLFSLFHLFVKTGVTHHTCSAHDFTTRFIQSTDTSYNGSFQNIRQICNMFKRLNHHLSYKSKERAHLLFLTNPLAHSYTTSIKPNLRPLT